jgi:hypothetical protein
MNKTKWQLVLFVVVLIGANLACGFSASTANIKSASMARDSEGNDLTTTFSQNDDFYCIVELANAPDDTTVKAVWTAVDAANTDPNYHIDDAETTQGSGTLYFSLTNDGAWPTGTYKLDLYLNDELDRTLDFEVQ